MNKKLVKKRIKKKEKRQAKWKTKINVENVTKFKDQKMNKQNGAKMLQPQKFFNHIFLCKRETESERERQREREGEE